MADVKLNSLATKTNANAAAIMVKDSATQNQGAEGWITKAQLNQIIRDEIKAQMSAITSGTPDVPVLDGSTLKYMTLANFAKVAGGLLFRGQPTIAGFDESKVYQQGIYYLYGGNANTLGLGTNEGVLIALGPLGESYNFSSLKVQIFFKYDGSIFTWRLYNWSSQAWTSWKDF